MISAGIELAGLARDAAQRPAGDAHEVGDEARPGGRGSWSARGSAGRGDGGHRAYLLAGVVAWLDAVAGELEEHVVERRWCAA